MARLMTHVIARAADLVATLLGAPVSAGFVSACVACLDDRLVAGGFEDAPKERLRCAAVIGTDETPSISPRTASTTCTRCGR